MLYRKNQWNGENDVANQKKIPSQTSYSLLVAHKWNRRFASILEKNSTATSTSTQEILSDSEQWNDA